MRKVLILGAGLVVKPMVRFLLDNGYFVTLADMYKSKADKILKGHPNSKSVAWSVENTDMLDAMIKEHDIVVSMLPYRFHPEVAKRAIELGKNMVTASYVKPQMLALDSTAKEAGIIILNEMGLDPGIDHMSAKKIIDQVHSRGGQIEEFYSITGALPAPEVAETNPFKYKFSWSPIGVLMAGNNDARYIRKSREVHISSDHLFRLRSYVQFPDVGFLEVYPNRDSVPYKTLYDIPEAQTVFRGTFRYPGWSDIIDTMKRVGLFSEDEIDATDMTYRQLMAQLLDTDESNLEQVFAERMGLPADSLPCRAIKWLGLWDDRKIGVKDTVLNITGKLMIDKMMLQGDERDMVAMMHFFRVKYPNGKYEVIRSTLLDFGTPNTDTSIARTVSLPVAAAVTMILEGQINLTGVHIPVLPEIYNPVLEKLETLGIKMDEEFGLPDSYSIF